MQVNPSASIKKDDKIEGEQSASQEKTTPVTPSAAPTPMDVDSSPCFTAPLMEEEEKKSTEPLAQVTVSASPISVPKSAEIAKDKAPMSKEMKAAEGVPASKIIGSSSSSKPSESARSRKRNAPLRPIEEDSIVPDESLTRCSAEEELPRNLLETFPPFPVEDGPNGIQ
jgi:hypothetical protein